MDINYSFSEDTIVVTFIDFVYLPVFKFFHFFYQNLKMDNLLVISLDKQIHQYCIDNNIKSILYEFDLKKLGIGEFMCVRLNVMNQLYKQLKKNIIYTDADCFWIKNIISLINDKNIDCDLIGHTALGHPTHLVQKYGFVLCFGFFYMKYSEKNHHFFDQMIDFKKLHPKMTNDDQIIMNEYIFDSAIDIEKNIKNDPLFIHKILLKNGVKVGYVSFSHIHRTYNKNLILWHPYMPSPKMQDKVAQVWKEIEPHYFNIKDSV